MAQIITTELKEVPDYVKIKDVKRQLNLPSKRDIIAFDRNTGQMRRLEDNDVIHPDAIYTDVPRYIRGAVNVLRMYQELELLKHLPETIAIYTDPPEFSFVLLEGFYLGEKYDPKFTNLLILLPPNYPQTPPGLNTRYGIYVTGNLKRNGKPLQCGRDQYHWTCNHNPKHMFKKGWAWWCFADFESWSPHRDNLLKIILLLKETFENPEKQRFG